jgi:hypothetical protein
MSVENELQAQVMAKGFSPSLPIYRRLFPFHKLPLNYPLSMRKWTNSRNFDLATTHTP